MKLAVQKRAAGKQTNALRREGNVPAILYGRSRADQPLSVKTDEFQAVLRNMKSGLLATTVFELQIDGKTQKAVVKEVQYHHTSYAIEHIDFAAVVDDQPITISVPLNLVGVADCAGVKLGGFVRQVIRTVKVRCLPKFIPQEFTIDVKDLVVGQSVTLADIKLGSDVRPIGKMDQVAVVIGKKAGAA